MTGSKKAQRETVRARVKADLMSGVEGAPLYDAWGGAGWWTPKVTLNEREALIVADYVAALVAERAS